MQNLRWTDDGKRSAEISERAFAIDRQGKAIPGVVWQPLRATGAQPLVLMGHGGTGHKRSDKLERMAEIFTTDYGWWAAAIDGPVHGARGSVTDAADSAYREMWTQPNVVQDMIDDWTAVLDALTQLDDIDKTRIGYWGVYASVVGASGVARTSSGVSSNSRKKPSCGVRSTRKAPTA